MYSHCAEDNFLSEYEGLINLGATCKAKNFRFAAQGNYELSFLLHSDKLISFCSTGELMSWES